jgi:hypothetical protein
VAGETQNYHETRDPYYVSANFSAVAPSTTSLSIIPVLRLPSTNLAFPAGYWNKPGRKWLIEMWGAVTTAATPGNLTMELRYQTGTPTDAGGTILATSAAVAAGANKTGASWYLRAWVESRADPSTFVPTAAPMYGYGMWQPEPSSVVLPAANNPFFFPATTGAAVNVDMTLAGTIHVDLKRSGSTAESITVHDLNVTSLT